MELYQLNPFIRYAQVQPALLNGDSFRMAYDCRLFYVLAGSGQMLLKEQTMELALLSAVFIPPATPYRVLGSMRVIALNFDLTHRQCHRKAALDPAPVSSFDPALLFETDMPPQLCKPFVMQECTYLDVQIKNLVTEFQLPGGFAEIRTSAMLKQILCDLLQNRLSPQTSALTLVNRAVGYIQRHSQQNIKNEAVAEALGYNALYLNRVFKAHTGLTMHAYLTRERIRIASRLLDNTELPIEAVAKECGYETRSHFCTVFRQITGLTPLEFRNRNTRQG